MAMHQCLPAATRSGQGLLARLSCSLPARLTGSPLPSNSNKTSHFLAFLSRSPRSFPRIFASSLAGPPETATASTTVDGVPGVLPPPDARPRMPAVPEDRPKPTTAVAVVEAYLDKLWRDFFTNPHNWFDNRLRRRAPKYADYKNKLTKEGLWITAKWNPPWVRTELSLMTNFRAVPYDDPMWAKKAAEEEEEKREKPPLVPPGAWLANEIKAKRAAASGTGSTVVDSWRRSDNVPSSTPAAPTPGSGQEQQ
eukprot:c15267_g1_i1 orf=428-1183(-)